jgi:chromosome segregation ATPase
MSKENEKDNEDFISKLKKMKSNMKSQSVIGETLGKIEILEKENEELKAKITKNSELVEEKEKTLKKFEEDKIKIEQDFNKQKDEVSNLSKKAKDQEEKVKQLTRDNTSLNNKLQKLTKEKESLDLKLKELEKSGKVEKVQTPASGIDMSKGLIEDLQSQLTKKKRQTAELEEKTNRLESQISQLTKEKEKGKAGVKPLEISKPEIIKPEIKKPETASEATVPLDAEASKTLVENLTSELNKKKTQLVELNNKIKMLTQENKNITEELDDLKEKASASKPAPTVEVPQKPAKISEKAGASSPTLNVLVQNLQSDLNKYKKIAAQLKEENEKMKKSVESGATPSESGDVKQLKRENDALRSKIADLEKERKLDAEASGEVLKSALEGKIKELEETIKKQEKTINDLKSSKPVAAEVEAKSGAPMAGLVGDLQSKLNKLKIELKEKDKIIEELKKKDSQRIQR